MKTPRPINRLLAEGRDEAGLSADELIAQAGISRSTLYRIEHREWEPKWAPVVNLLHALGYDVIIRKHEDETQPAPYWAKCPHCGTPFDGRQPLNRPTWTRTCPHCRQKLTLHGRRGESGGWAVPIDARAGGDQDA